MKLPAPYVCDECGTQKKESNHWWIASVGRMVFAIVAWASDDPEKSGSVHLCSESCAAKALSKWMASLQSANAGKLQPANEPTEERQKLEQNARRGYEKAFEPTDYNPK